MASKIFIFLFSAFAAYSYIVYISSDKGNKEGTPDKHVIAGWKTWQDKNCQSCHQLYGLGGYMGPDLTNIVSQPGRNTAYLLSFIKHGSDKMPDFELNETQSGDLVSFLAWVDKSGKSKVREDQVNWSGNYMLDKPN